MESFLSKVRSPLIVETGCSRSVDSWEGDGQSTIIFDELAERFGGTFCSVDTNIESVEIARSLIRYEKSSISLLDSVAWLTITAIALGANKIDLLYLDSFDFYPGNEQESALHHLMELTAAAPALRHGSLVFVDDNIVQPDGSFIGKGMYVDRFMKKSGRQRVFTGYQLGWIW
jgi:hypothetical protein